MTCPHCDNVVGGRLSHIEAVLERVEKAMSGNGQPGLIQRVGSLESWRGYITGATAILTALVAVFGGLLIGKLK